MKYTVYKSGTEFFAEPEGVEPEGFDVETIATVEAETPESAVGKAIAEQWTSLF